MINYNEFAQKSHSDSFAFSISEIEHGLSNPFASGMTTCLFDSLSSNKIKAVTVDRVKLSYMNKAKLPGFKIILETEDSILYEMDKLYSLTKDEEDEIERKIDFFYQSLNKEYLSFEKNSLEYKLIQSNFSIEMANSLMKIFKKYSQSKIFLDLHKDQFLKDKDNNIYCVDAVMDLNIYNEIQHTN